MIRVRRLQSSDLDNFVALRLQALNDNPKSYLQIYEEEVKRPRAFHANMLAYNFIMGAFVDDVLVGYTIMSFMGPTKLAHKSHIWGAYVQPEHRKRNLAKKMREELFEEARKLGLTTCISSIVASNKTAVALHKAVGYTEMYREKNGIKHADGEFDDLIHFIKHLC